MDKQKKQLIVVGILVIILMFSVLSSFKKKPAAKAQSKVALPAPVMPHPASSAPAAPLKSDEKKVNVQAERAKLPWGRDPFAMPSAKEYQIGELRLKGVSFDKIIGGFAYINNEIVKKGDIVGDYEVIDIEKDRVLLKKGNQSFYLVFPGQE